MATRKKGSVMTGRDGLEQDAPDLSLTSAGTYHKNDSRHKSLLPYLTKRNIQRSSARSYDEKSVRPGDSQEPRRMI